MKISLSGFGFCLSLFFLFMFSFSNAQVTIDKKINMTGALNDDRRITNVGDVVSNADAVNAQTLQKGTLTYASSVFVLGDNIYVYTTPSFYPTVGTQITFKATNKNISVPFLSVNGTGLYAIVKSGGQLMTGDIKVGQLVTVIFDGSVWTMMSPTSLTITEFTGYTASTEGSSVTFNHGITGTIISVSLTVEYTPSNFVTGEYSRNPGYKASVYWNSTSLTVVNATSTGGGSYLILNKPYRVVITWK